MARIVHCVVLKRPAESLDRPPHPGALGQRILENVSQEGWKLWLQRLALMTLKGEMGYPAVLSAKKRGLTTAATTKRATSMSSALPTR